MGRMGPGHTLMAKCSCIEILTGEGGGGAIEWGVAEGEEADEEGVEAEEGGMARWEVEGGGGGLETLMWTVRRDCGIKMEKRSGEGQKEGEKDKDNYTERPSASSDSVTLHFAGGQWFSKSALVLHSHGRMGEPITFKQRYESP